MKLFPSRNSTPQDSFKKRYTFKLGSNLVSFALSLATAGIVPRSLGPKQFGDFSFLTNFFTQILIFLNCGTAYPFYGRISQEKGYSPVVPFYFIFICFGALLVLICTVLVHAFGLQQRIWPNQSYSIIFIAAGLSILLKIGEIPSSMVDAYGNTVSAEIVRFIHKVLITIALLILAYNQLLSLNVFFSYQYIITSVLFLMLLWVLGKNGHWFFQYPRLTLKSIKYEFAYFYKNSNPLFILSIVSLITGIFDRWLLQTCGGSTQQGYFGFSANIATFSSVFITSMTPLLMRDFAIASEANDLKVLAKPFVIIGPILFLFGAYLSCFLAVQSSNICSILGGANYDNAKVTLTIMVFYPVFQIYGQICGSFLTMTGKTKLFRNICSVFLILGLPVTYFLLTSTTVANNISSSGLAIKTVLLDVVSVTVLLFLCCNILKISFKKLIKNQLITVVVFFALAFSSSFLIAKIFSNSNEFIHFLVSGILYSFVAVLLIVFKSDLFGIDKNIVIVLKNDILKKINSFLKK